MGRYGKWIAGITADDSVRQAAVQSLTQRLANVATAVALAAAGRGEDREAIHQLRVQARRAEAALQLYWDLLRKKPRRWFRHVLRDLRQAAGRVRDVDIVRERTCEASGGGNPAWHSALVTQRQAALRPLLQLFRKLREGKRIRRHAVRLLRFRRKRRALWQHTRLADWANACLPPWIEPLAGQIEYNPLDLVNLHQLRIRIKQLRYVLELLAPAFSPAIRDELYTTSAMVQEKLGGIHDQAVVRDRLIAWSVAASHHENQVDRSEVGLWIQRECEHLTALRRAFWADWDRALRAALRTQVASCQSEVARRQEARAQR